MKNTKINKRILIFTIILFIGILLFPHFSSAKEVLATGLSPANIRAAVNSASPGDTVVLPAGDVGSDGSWNVNQAYSAAVVIPAGISLRGQGVDKTIIRQTAGYYAFFYFNPSRATTTYTTEIQGFKLIGAGTSGVPSSTGYGLRVTSLPEIKIHNIWIEDKSTVLLAIDDCKGVVYNSTFRYSILETSYGSGGYGVAVKGAYPRVWPVTYPQLGTENAIFIEDNTFYGIKHAIEGESGAHYVVRHNKFSGGWYLHAQIDMHGPTDPGPAYESGLAAEVYNNDITQSSCDRSLLVHVNAVKGVSLRGGCGVIFNNTFHSSPGSSSSSSIVLSPLDINVKIPALIYPDDYPVLWQPRNVYAWGNTYDGKPVDANSNSAQWFVEDRNSTNSMGTFPDYHNGPKPGYAPYTYPHPLRGAVILFDVIKPIVTSFDVQPRTTTGLVTATYTVTDNQSLARVELWRTTDLNGQPNGNNWTQVTNRTISGTSSSGTFTDTPSAGTYWYGIHVVDAANNIGTEPSSIKVVKQDQTSLLPQCKPFAGKEILAKSLSPADIQAAATAAKDGDMVVLPAGDYSGFNVAVSFKNGVSLRGQGRDKTIIRAATNYYDNCFHWNYEHDTDASPVEIKDFSLYGPGPGEAETGVGINVRNGDHLLDFKIHNLHLEGFNHAGIVLGKSQRGLIYNCSFKDNYDSAPLGLGYGVSIGGDGIWDDPKPPLGTADAVFVEDCTFDHCKHGVASGTGAHYVVRYNTFKNGHGVYALLDAHGYRGVTPAGTSTWEAYKNTFIGRDNGTDWGFAPRGGSGVFWGNTFTSNIERWACIHIDTYGDYPDPYMVKDAYYWDNYQGGILKTDVAFIENPTYTQKDREYFMYKKPGYVPYTYPHPLRCLISPPPSDTTPPRVTSFSIQPRIATDPITFAYTVTDNQSLTRVELWRTTDSGGVPNGSGWTQITNRTISGTSSTGTFTDTPSAGTYWYGIHVVDAANNIGTEPSSIKVVKQDQTSLLPQCKPFAGKEILAKSLSPTDIQAAATAAKDGDMVVLPAGDYQATTWTYVSMKNGVSLRGAGITSTIIRLPTAYYGNGFEWNVAHVDATNAVEIKNFSLYGPGKEESELGNGILMRHSDHMLDFVIHDLYIKEFNSAGLRFYKAKRGLIYNSTFSYNIDAAPYNYGAGISINGDGIWPETIPPLGTADMVFVEDCTFIGNKHGVSTGSCVNHVVRYCSFSVPSSGAHAMSDVHGNYSPPPYGGGITWEIYHNDFVGDEVITVDRGVGHRGGQVVVWSNTFTSNISKWACLMIDSYGAYPDPYMVQNAYFWNNLVGGVPATDVAYIENPTYTQKDREYFMYKKPGYTPYTYPHPLRCLTSPPSSDTVKPIVSSFDVQPRNTMGSTTITWTATDNQALTQIRVVRTTDLNNQPDVSGWTAINTRTVSGTQNTSQYVDTLIPGIYWYGLQAVDSAGNIGYEPAPIRVVVSTADTTPPSAPTNLSVTVVSTSQINLSWTASTDNAGVTSYRIYRGGTQIAISTTTSYQNTGLSPSTAYTYTVAAYDAAGNVSGQSNQTLATTPPSAPCVGTCKTNSCSSYTNCTSASGTCSSGYCCSGACTALLTQPPGQPGVGGTGGNIIEFKNPLTYENLDDLISGIADLLKILAIAGGLIMVILSGIMIMTAGGKEEQVTKGKKMLMWTLIGVAIALSAGFIIDLVQELLK